MSRVANPDSDVNVYVASSWRNEWQPRVVDALRNNGIAAYDFKAEDEGAGFHWSSVDPDPPESWGVSKMIRVLDQPRAVHGFHMDFDAMHTATHCILVLPSGRSTHLEAGWMIGQGKPTAVFIPEYDGPDLMWKMADLVTDSMQHLMAWMGLSW